jgi:hypothetical protein
MASETKVLLKAPSASPRPTVWVFVDKPLDGKYGECDFDNKRVELDPSMGVEDRVRTICHEVGHLTGPFLNEDFIELLEENIAAALLSDPRLKITLAEGA